MHMLADAIDSCLAVRLVRLRSARRDHARAHGLCPSATWHETKNWWLVSGSVQMQMSSVLKVGAVRGLRV